MLILGLFFTIRGTPPSLRYRQLKLTASPAQAAGELPDAQVCSYTAGFSTPI